MAEYKDECGNPIPLVDEYGNPIPEQIPHTTTGTGTGGYGTTVHHETAAGVAVGQTEAEHQSGLHRPGNFSSSSSPEDDDEQGGGRKKKSFKEKIEEKLPGEHKSEAHGHGETTTTAISTTHHEVEGEGHHEKKGIMEKKKETSLNLTRASFVAVYLFVSATRLDSRASLKSSKITRT